MHTEHLRNLHPGWVVGGWLIAVAVTSAAYLVVVGAGLVPTGRGEILAVAAAVAAGFFVGGLFVGWRWSDAPILHGGAITLLSVVLWFVGALALPGRLDELGADAPSVLGLVLLQLVASVAGGWTGRKIVRGEAPGLDT